jgi:hypothetical protein
MDEYFELINSPNSMNNLHLFWLELGTNYWVIVYEVALLSCHFANNVPLLESS